MKPNIIVVGKSGSGKSSSLRNLNPETTAVLNIERKQLPFKGAMKFKNVGIPDLNTFNAAFKKAVESTDIDTIVIESFTSLVEMIYREADIRFKGFDVWSFYNKEIDRILNMSKNSDKYIVFLAIDGAYDGEDGVQERFVAVDGNRWKKRVEKEFVLCLYTDNYYGEGQTKFQFRTQSNGKDSAKSPMEMFDELMIPNDLALVIDKCEEYYS
jgi:hypothetical protein|tara:strand:+ start:716 stop:1351 length:636 start_codon:yes stop_codon:yes gene_type:complete